MVTLVMTLSGSNRPKCFGPYLPSYFWNGWSYSLHLVYW